ncbi:aldehyde dehydrogenase family protein [Chryseolinea sp. H1M3-3]|uniref:aldehyde dehydrogenase family protein n=1 Tax=Chryseolinea sp. H1M3-3 TaxID=3034144 RepID=UPI0023ED15AD|nr:aldehyde dehydrogenase family protein [Chryseolinea sp. H1M3-3]
MDSQTLETFLDKIFALQKRKSNELRIEPIHNRKLRIHKLREWIHVNRTAIQEAMYVDFKKHPLETDGIELLNVLAEIKNTLSHLDDWAAPKKVDAPLTMLGTRSFIQYEPRGVCLVLAPWNYPFLLCVGPMVSALAAGNTVILKPSELTPHVSAVIKRMSDEIFDPAVVSTFEGGVEVSQHLLRLPFDHIFFTGSPTVGKIVMKAAADNLASVTLELGGKSPSIITRTANLADAAERTAAAKFVNNGQTCVAPDYILIDQGIAETFIPLLIGQIEKLFTENDQAFEVSEHYCRIINDKNFLRVQGLLDEAIAQGAQVRYGGSSDRPSRFFHPTILSNLSLTSRIMKEEIFGPILPIVTYDNLGRAIAFVNDMPKPLALYIFSTSKKEQSNILQETSSGGVCINDSAIHFLHHNLPFGGVNNSGIGKSHGYYGFLAFSNEKPVLRQRKGLTTIKTFYPPYTKRSQKLMEWFLKLF